MQSEQTLARLPYEIQVPFGSRSIFLLTFNWAESAFSHTESFYETVEKKEWDVLFLLISDGMTKILASELFH